MQDECANFKTIGVEKGKGIDSTKAKESTRFLPLLVVGKNSCPPRLMSARSEVNERTTYRAEALPSDSPLQGIETSKTFNISVNQTHAEHWSTGDTVDPVSKMVASGDQRNAKVLTP